jgi:AcrR family transcriptional regulator
MPTQGERSEATRTKLLGVARKLFRARGYADTSLDDIAARAGVTKGAFYHHFEDKKAIFTAVFEEAERQLVEAAAAGGRGGDVWSRFRAGCRAFLEASMDPGIQRVALHDAPVVLGWEVWREIADRHSLGVDRSRTRESDGWGRCVRGRRSLLTHANVPAVRRVRDGRRDGDLPPTHAPGRRE